VEHSALIEGDGLAKVRELDQGVRVLRLVEDILRLDVAVRDPLSVAVVDRVQDLLDRLGGLLLAKVALLDDLLKEVASRAELAHDVEEAGVLVKLEDFDDVRVVL